MTFLVTDVAQRLENAPGIPLAAQIRRPSQP